VNELHYGDNLDVLRGFAPECVDLVYLDPPFNSNASYNVLFRSPQGQESPAQIEAFEDTWHWGEQAEREFKDLLHQENTDVADMMAALRAFLGENDMMAYLTMMANRLLKLHNVLKPTGSLYLHCDPTASHYLKIVLDGVFGKECFTNELIWIRSLPHGNILKKFGASHDAIFFYKKTPTATWNGSFLPHREEYIKDFYKFKEVDGRVYRLISCINPNPDRPNLTYEWNGVTKVWKYTKGRMQEMHDKGLLVYSKNGIPAYKGYLDSMKGIPTQDVWADIPPLMGSSAERLGYPTQKPVALLERIIAASSNPGDVVLDPFCGCGTALHAAQKLGRRWIGIDITHLAISLIEKRLKDAFPDIKYETHGTPKDLAGAAHLAQRDPYQFQWWACSLVEAQPYKGKKKGADGGIDGVIFTQDELSGEPRRIIVSVKGGANVDVKMIREFAHVVDASKSILGLFVTLTAPKTTMLKAAAAAGFYRCPHNQKDYPKIQILTIEGLLSGHERPQYLDLSRGAATFKQAPREKKKQKQGRLV